MTVDRIVNQWRAMPDEIKVVYTFECMACHRKSVAEYYGLYVMAPDAPKGWHRFANQWICDKHTLKILLDGSDVTVDMGYASEAQIKERKVNA